MNARGGKRIGAGRKREPDKVKQIFIGVKQSVIDKHGEPKIKDKLKKTIESLS